jgi:hypothetical protein
MARGQPRPKPKRFVRLMQLPDDRGVGVFCIVQGKHAHWYTFCEIRCDIGGRGFVVHKLGLGEIYHVRVGDPEDYSCECLGFYRTGSCKHAEMMTMLVNSGLINDWMT